MEYFIVMSVKRNMKREIKMAQYQDKKNDLARTRFFDLFGDLSEESQLKLIECLSKIQKVVRI